MGEASDPRERLRELSAIQQQRELTAEELLVVASCFRALGNEPKAAEAEQRAGQLAPPRSASPAPWGVVDEWIAKGWLKVRRGAHEAVWHELVCRRCGEGYDHVRAACGKCGQAFDEPPPEVAALLAAQRASRPKAPDGQSPLDAPRLAWLGPLLGFLVVGAVVGLGYVAVNKLGAQAQATIDQSSSALNQELDRREAERQRQLEDAKRRLGPPPGIASLADLPQPHPPGEPSAKVQYYLEQTKNHATQRGISWALLPDPSAIQLTNSKTGEKMIVNWQKAVAAKTDTMQWNLMFQWFNQQKPSKN